MPPVLGRSSAVDLGALAEERHGAGCACVLVNLALIARSGEIGDREQLYEASFSARGWPGVVGSEGNRD